MKAFCTSGLIYVLLSLEFLVVVLKLFENLLAYYAVK